jgi:hypothetical protein
MLPWVLLVCKHKYFVFIAGLKTKTNLWRLLKHDFSKFYLSEAPHYANQFFGEKNNSLGFSYAWNHHQKCNDHHWEYWVLVTGHNRGGYPDGSPLPMPEQCIREMVADWFAASRAYEGKWPQSFESWTWWNENFEKIRLHPETRKLCLKIAQVTMFKMNQL